MAGEEKFMTIAGLEAYKSKSFEEVRVDDYLKAYTTTGKAPPPSPETPTSDTDRLALGLPLLFKPYAPTSLPSASASTSTSISAFAASTSTKPSITTAAELPLAHEFHAIKVEGETYQSIACTALFAFFSPEELRYYAYLRGNITAPPTVKMDLFVKSPVNTASTAAVPPSTTATTTTATPGATTTATLDSGETLQSIMAQQAFVDHSFEELRVYYLLAGRREVTSAEIRAYLGQQPASSPVPPPPPVPPTQPHPPHPTTTFSSTPTTFSSASTFPPTSAFPSAFPSAFSSALPSTSTSTSTLMPGAGPSAPTSTLAPQSQNLIGGGGGVGGGSISTPLPIQPKATPSFSFKF